MSKLTRKILKLLVNYVCQKHVLSSKAFSSAYFKRFVSWYNIKISWAYYCLWAYLKHFGLSEYSIWPYECPDCAITTEFFVFWSNVKSLLGVLRFGHIYGVWSIRMSNMGTWMSKIIGNTNYTMFKNCIISVQKQLLE